MILLKTNQGTTDTIISPIFYMGNKKKLINKGFIDKLPDNISVFVDVFAACTFLYGKGQ